MQVEASWRVFGVAPDLIEDDRAERRGADAAERESADRKREVAGADRQRGGGRDEIARAPEVDLVDDPDARPRGGDEAEHDDGEAAKYSTWDSADQRAELGREPEQDRGERGDHEHERGIDLGDGHDADVLRVRRDARAAARAGDHGRDAVAQERASEVT